MKKWCATKGTIITTKLYAISGKMIQLKYKINADRKMTVKNCHKTVKQLPDTTINYYCQEINEIQT